MYLKVVTLLMVGIDANKTSNDLPNCTDSAADDFLIDDGMSREERKQGWFFLYVLAGVYAIGALAVVCDDYFVPIMHEFSERLKLPSDVGGATFMAFGTSCPELFVSLVGVFITEGDIGLGAVIGSAVFNTLAIASICGLFAGATLVLNWRPISRDCAIYVVAVGTLYWVTEDGKIYWYEAVVLVAEYVVYIVVLWLNAKFHKYCRGPITSYDFADVEDSIANYTTGSYTKVSSVSTVTDLYNETAYSSREPKVVDKNNINNNNNNSEFPSQKAIQNLQRVYGINVDDSPNGLDSKGTSYSSFRETLDMMTKESSSGTACKEIIESDEPSSVFAFPSGNIAKKAAWIIWWPVKLLFYVTIPEAQDRSWPYKLVTFFMSIAYIGFMSYIAAWMVSVFGDTFLIPDSVMGLTFLALGSSFPEIISSIIVTKQSLGNMALSNAMGGNAFTLLICLGIPWIIKSLTSDDGYVKIYSGGITYSVLGLFLSVVVMYLTLCASRFRLNKKVGGFCLFLYIVYLTISVMYVMNVFTYVTHLPC